jgi:hypothetical protein
LPSASAADGTFPTIFYESFLSCLSPCHGGPAGCTCLVLPQRHRPSRAVKWVGFPLPSANTTFHGYLFGAAAISLCSGLQVCLPPGSFLPLQVSLQGSWGVFIQAERASLPSHALDKLAARLQAIGGARTFTLQDSQHCRLLLTARYFSAGPSDSPHGGHPALRSTTDSGSSSALAVSSFRFRARLDVCIPSAFFGQRGTTPAFGYSAPHLGARGTLTLLDDVLLSTRFAYSALALE